MSHFIELIVIGGGAAGMAAAVRAAQRGRKTLLIEKADRTGRKILASGNGRCNLLNSGTPRYFGDAGFALQVLEQWPCGSIAAFLQEIGLMVTEEEEGRIYPVTNHAVSVAQALARAMKVNGVTINRDAAVTAVRKKRNRFEITCNTGDVIEAEKVIVACGGAAQSRLGGTEDGYQMLQSLGHTVFPPEPALVPLITDAKSITGLSGIRVKCRVSVFRGEERLQEETGEVLFTDYGVSGICVMQCARTARKGMRLELDLMSRAMKSRGEALAELRRRRALFSELSPVCLLEGILHPSVSYAVMKQAGIPLRGETSRQITDEQLDRILASAYAYRIGIEGNRGMEYAQVTAGGADCREFDPATMESRLVPGLYAAGEVLNVDGDCGGFNLMFAFASGLTAGSAV